MFARINRTYRFIDNKRIHVLRCPKGFTVVEVIVASSIMTILAIGTLSVYSYVVKLNQGNNLRSQALTVLQSETEYYRSLKFVPGAGITALELQAGSRLPKQASSQDGTTFTIDATVINYAANGSVQNPVDETTCTFKEITITATPINPRPKWLENLQTKLTVQRVRSN